MEQLERAWRERDSTRSDLHDFPRFTPHGLVLGADTVLAKADAAGCDGPRAARLQALLAVAYGPDEAHRALGHVKAATLRWTEGDEALATLHLALARLARLASPRDAARRLFMADGLMRAGVSPATIIETLSGVAGREPLSKFDPSEPRIPKGQGRPSGRWTTGPGGSAGDAGRPAPWNDPTETGPRAGPGIGSLIRSAGMADEVVSFLARIVTIAGAAETLGAFTLMGVLFWPSRAGPKGAWVDVGGPAKLRYYWSPDETVIRVQYQTTSGLTRIATATLESGGEFRDSLGRPIARLLTNEGVMVELATLEDIATDPDEPRLCPSPPDKDRNGARAQDRDYEDYVKKYLNPDNPTPRGFGYALRNPVNASGLTYFDDCWRRDGTMVEIKNNYARIIELFKDRKDFSLRTQWLDQSASELLAAKDRRVMWFFNDKVGQAYARSLFDTANNGRERIATIYLPMKVYRR